MSDFPSLKTGAVLQYPAQKDLLFSTKVVRFVDGSEQRFRNYARPMKRWLIQLELLDQSELHSLREFFRMQSGADGVFTFTDPWDSTVYASCSFEDDQMDEQLLSESQGKTTLAIRQNGT